MSSVTDTVRAEAAPDVIATATATAREAIPEVNFMHLADNFIYSLLYVTCPHHGPVDHSLPFIIPQLSSGEAK